MLGISFTTMTTPELDGISAIKAAARYGYDGVDLRVSDYKGEIVPRATDKELKELKDAAVSMGVKISGLLCYNNKGGESGKSWEDMKNSILFHLDIAQKINSPSIRIMLDSPLNYKNPDYYINRSIENINTALIKDNSDTVILLQNHKSNISALECAEIVKLSGNKRIGMVFSPDHSHMVNEDMAKVYKAIKGITRQLYVADVITMNNEYKSILPGKGEVNIMGALNALGGSSFDGWITLKWEKIWENELEGYETALPYFKKYIHSCLKGMDNSNIGVD